MKVPVSWLKEYVDPPATPQELAKLLVMAGVGIESIEGDVLDLEITANRADLLSMLGVARETGFRRSRSPSRATTSRRRSRSTSPPRISVPGTRRAPSWG